MDEEFEFDLSPLLAMDSIDINSPFAFSPSLSPVAMPEVVPRPISKRRGKKRSSRACTTCRARKVRCNIVAHGAPCSNCRHDEIECVLPLSRRQKSARERAEASLRANSMIGSEAGERRSGTVEFDNCSTSQHDEAGISGYQDRQWEREQSQELGPHRMPMSEQILAEVLPVSCLSPTQSLSVSIPATSSRTRSWIQIQLPLASAPVNKSHESQVPQLPRVFTPFPRHLAAADLLYLHSRDALTLPSDKLQLEILKAYVEFVHGNMPILDLEEFFSAVKYGPEAQDGQRSRGIEKENTLKKQIPFLLFQAVMFAGVGFVSMSALRSAGYHSRETAQRTFFSRVRLCYDFDTCTDRQSIIQSLLLMTQSTPPPSHDGKDSWHWLGLAISLSYSLGLNRNQVQHSSSLRKNRLERRIWWSAFIRDRTLALSPTATLARAVRIRRDDCDVEMLSLSDFELDEDDSKDDGFEDMRARQDALDCVEKAELCWCSNDLLITSVHQLPQFLETQRAPQHILIPQRNILEVSGLDSQPYTASSYASAPIFENPEDASYRMASSSSPSVRSDCPTPLSEPVFHQPIPEMGKVLRNNNLGGVYGGDGEYDDYMEYLKPSSTVEKLEKKEKTWAFQLDCENDRVLEV